MAGFRKRTRAAQPWRRSTRARRNGRFNKNRRRVGNRTRNGTVRTGYTAANSNINFTRKRGSLRVYRRKLWDTTLFKPHYRSILASSFVITTPIGANTGTFHSVRALSTLLPFWTTAGGTQQIDALVVPPLFSPSTIVIRGGKVKTTVTNRSTDESVKVKIWCLWAKDAPTSVFIPANGTPFPEDWDPTLIPDFHQGFKVLFAREVMLLPGARPVELTCKLKVQKLDGDTFLNEAGRQVHWMYLISETDDSDATATTVGVSNSHNLSFVGDAST